MDNAHSMSLDVGRSWELSDFPIYPNAYLFYGHLQFIISQSLYKLEGVFWIYFNASYVLVLAVDF